MPVEGEQRTRGEATSGNSNSPTRSREQGENQSLKRSISCLLVRLRFAMPGPRVPERATLIAEKADAAGRHVHQVELCEPHLNFLIDRERKREACRHRLAHLQIGNDQHRAVMAASVQEQYGRLRILAQLKPSKILSVAPVFNSDPPSIQSEVTCSLCDEVDTLIIDLNQPAGDLAWLRRNDFYFVCGRHRKWESN